MKPRVNELPQPPFSDCLKSSFIREQHYHDDDGNLLASTIMWDGINPLAAVNVETLDQGQWINDRVVELAAWRLRIVGGSVMVQCYYVMCDGIDARLYAAWCRLREAAGDLNAFAMRTVHRLGIVHWADPRYVPRWRDARLGRGKR